MKKENKEMLMEIYNKLGEEEILLQLAEECSELAQACLKYRRVKKGLTPKSEQEAYNNLVEEIADVKTIMEQITTSFESRHIIEELANIHDNKTKRWYNRTFINQNYDTNTNKNLSFEKVKIDPVLMSSKEFHSKLNRHEPFLYGYQVIQPDGNGNIKAHYDAMELAIDYFSMSNDTFYDTYGFNWIPQEPYWELGKQYRTLGIKANVSESSSMQSCFTIDNGVNYNIMETIKSYCNVPLNIDNNILNDKNLKQQINNKYRNL